MTNMNYNYTEEAFLLSSLQEVVKIWGKGKGSSTFNLKVCDGVAELALSFSLGYPSDLHSSPPPQPDCHPQHVHDYPQHPQFPQQKVRHHRRRRKGPAQRERDRLRAEEHHSRQNFSKTAASAVILPFLGKMLPINDPNHADKAEFPAAAPVDSSQIAAATVATSDPASPQPGTAHIAAVRPTKPVLSAAAASKYVDADLAKKQLFPHPLPSCQVPLASVQQQAVKRKGYKMKEEDLWTKLFT